MPTSVVSTCHGLELFPISKIKKFARAGWNVRIAFNEGSSEEPIEIPGTVMVSATPSTGFIAKKITCRCSNLQAKKTEMLNALRGSRLIALYADERGRRKVCGSLDYPLTLEFSESGGVFDLTIEGRDLYSDSYVAQ